MTSLENAATPGSEAGGGRSIRTGDGSPNDTASPVLEGAIAAIERGWYVFPVRGKKPVVKWSIDATLDPDQVRTWFIDDRHGLGYGVACGPSSLVVIDEDRLDALNEFAAEHGEAVPPTFTVTTGRGAHYYFLQPEGKPLRNSTDLARGFDLRGVGGYVVGPGSPHKDGDRYSVQVDRDPAPLPLWLAQALRAPSHPTNNLEAHGRFTLSEVIPVGQRDDTLFRYACSLRERGVPVREALQLMEAAWRRCEQPSGNEYLLEKALEKIDRAWANYDGPTTLEIVSDAAAAQPTSGTPGIQVTRLSQAEPAEVDRLTDTALPLFAGMLTSLVGMGESCKTLLAVHAALEVCRNSQAVLVFDGEMNAASWRQRMTELGDDGSAANRCFYAEIDTLSIAPEKVYEIVSKYGIRLIIWDSASSVTSQVAHSENDNFEMTRAYDAMRKIVRTGPAGLIIDHATKNGESLIPRGGGAKFNSLDLAYGVRRVRGEPNPERDWVMRVTVEKDRHALLDGRDDREVLFHPSGNRRLDLTWFTPSDITVEGPDDEPDDIVAAIESLDPPPTSANEAVRRLRESGHKFARKKVLDAYKAWKAGQ